MLQGFKGSKGLKGSKKEVFLKHKFKSEKVKRIKS